MADRVLGVTLPLRRGANGYFENTTEVVTQIKSNLTNLLLTQKGERVMQPDFGCDIHRVVFEAQTDDGLAEVQSTIETAVQAWMPFLRIEQVTVTRNEDYNEILVTIGFTLLTNNGITDSITLVF